MISKSCRDNGFEQVMIDENDRGARSNKLGRVLIDISSTTLLPEERELLRHDAVAGCVLFNRNFEETEQVIDLCAQLRAVRPGLIIAVDHEGGSVQSKVGEQLTCIPAMKDIFSRTDTPSLSAVELGYAIGAIIGYELRQLGFSLVFSPVLDVDYGVSSVIGNRAISARPDVVSVVAREIISGASAMQLNCCGKHFPGHGHAIGDPLVRTPVDDRTMDCIIASASPFRQVASLLPAIMTAHVRYPRITSELASCSSFWNRRMLRDSMGFRGAIVCDDVSMAAARAIGTAADIICSALSAGADLVLLLNQSSATYTHHVLDRCVEIANQSDAETRTRVERLGTGSARLDEQDQKRYAAACEYLLMSTQN